MDDNKLLKYWNNTEFQHYYPIRTREIWKFGREVGYPLDRLPFYHMANTRTNNHFHSHSHLRVIQSSQLFGWACLWAVEGNQSSYRKPTAGTRRTWTDLCADRPRSAVRLNVELAYYETTVLTTVLPSIPISGLKIIKADGETFHKMEFF